MHIAQKSTVKNGGIDEKRKSWKKQKKSRKTLDFSLILLYNKQADRVMNSQTAGNRSLKIEQHEKSRALKSAKDLVKNTLKKETQNK